MALEFKVEKSGSLQYNTLDVIAEKERKLFRHSEKKNVTAMRKLDRFVEVFGRRDLVVELFKNYSSLFLPHTGGPIRAKFCTNRASDS